MASHGALRVAYGAPSDDAWWGVRIYLWELVARFARSVAPALSRADAVIIDSFLMALGVSYSHDEGSEAQVRADEVVEPLADEAWAVVKARAMPAKALDGFGSGEASDAVFACARRDMNDWPSATPELRTLIAFTMKPAHIPPPPPHLGTKRDKSHGPPSPPTVTSRPRQAASQRIAMNAPGHAAPTAARSAQTDAGAGHNDEVGAASLGAESIVCAADFVPRQAPGWNGLPFPAHAEKLKLPDGRVLDDAIVWPDFMQEQLGLDPAELWRDLLDVPVWPDDGPIPFRRDGSDPHWVRGSHPALRYRGHELKRRKLWLQSGYAKGLRRYGYTGWQHAISFATGAVEHVPPARTFLERLNDGLKRWGQPLHNHLIVTAYENEDHGIGFHSDKDGDFAPDSYFIVVKLGAPRPFAFRLRPTDEEKNPKPFFDEVLSAGTAVMVRAKAPAAANSLVQHGVPAGVEPVGVSGSIVTRSIATVFPWERVEREAARRRLAIIPGPDLMPPSPCCEHRAEVPRLPSARSTARVRSSTWVAWESMSIHRPTGASPFRRT